MHGQKEKSLPAKLTLGIILLLALALAAGLLWHPAAQTIWPTKDVSSSLLQQNSAWALFISFVIYFLRLAFGTFFFLKRKMDWSEVLAVGLWITIIFVALIWGHKAGEHSSWLLFAAGILLYLVGSWLNTFAEYRRHRFKQNPDNQGRLYTQGPNAYSRHPNYLGDVVLALGWSFLSGHLFTLIIPLLMALLFVFVHIPQLEGYLQQKYGDDFTRYRQKTAKLIPKIY
jgi:protein-S-isoprenylcysteine O-methyltransferase Ste14